MSLHRVVFGLALIYQLRSYLLLHLARLLHHYGLASLREDHFGMISFDFSKAYDRVPHTRLVTKLVELGVPRYLIAIIADWLTDRTFQSGIVTLYHPHV